MPAPIKTALLSLTLVALLSACSDNTPYETAYCTLVDISGTYAQEKSNVVTIVIAGILPQMVSGDSLFFFAIDSNSYSEDNLIAKMTLDYRPTQANTQKVELAKELETFANSGVNSQLTDVSGAMMLCADYLKATKSGTKIMFVFSDMKEELPNGVVRQFDEEEFAGIDIVAMNIIKLGADSANPDVYRKRLENWDTRTKASGARSWETLIDSTKISDYIQKTK